MIAWVGVMALISGQSYKNITRITKEGKKNVVRGIITDRFKKYVTKVTNGEESTTAFPYLKIGDKELHVDHRMNWKYNVGDAVEFHYAEMDFFGHQKSNMFFFHSRIKGAGVNG